MIHTMDVFQVIIQIAIDASLGPSHSVTNNFYHQIIKLQSLLDYVYLRHGSDSYRIRPRGVTAIIEIKLASVIIC